jgi:hypothetical protein
MVSWLLKFYKSIEFAIMARRFLLEFEESIITTVNHKWVLINLVWLIMGISILYVSNRLFLKLKEIFVRLLLFLKLKEICLRLLSRLILELKEIAVRITRRLFLELKQIVM